LVEKIKRKALGKTNPALNIKEMIFAQTLGGGRTDSTKTAGHCFAKTGSVRKVETITNITVGNVLVVLGEAEWAAIQTVQDDDSVALEC
jgi:hypothetical protein